VSAVRSVLAPRGPGASPPCAVERHRVSATRDGGQLAMAWRASPWPKAKLPHGTPRTQRTLKAGYAMFAAAPPRRRFISTQTKMRCLAKGGLDQRFPAISNTETSAIGARPRLAPRRLWCAGCGGPRPMPKLGAPAWVGPRWAAGVPAEDCHRPRRRRTTSPVAWGRKPLLVVVARGDWQVNFLTDRAETTTRSYSLWTGWGGWGNSHVCTGPRVPDSAPVPPGGGLSEGEKRDSKGDMPGQGRLPRPTSTRRRAASRQRLLCSGASVSD